MNLKNMDRRKLASLLAELEVHMREVIRIKNELDKEVTHVHPGTFQTEEGTPENPTPPYHP